MFKRVLVLAVLLILVPSLSKADSTSPVSVSGIFSSLPNLKQGIAYDIKSGNAAYFSTAEILNKWGFSVSGGYASSSGIVASLDYDIGGLSKLGINIPLLTAVDLRVGFMVGLSDISTASSTGDAERNKLIYGPEVTIVSTKF